MGPYYDTAIVDRFNRTPEQIRLMERRFDGLDEPPSGNARMLFGAVMMVLAIVAYSIDIVGQQASHHEVIEMAHHSDE